MNLIATFLIILTIIVFNVQRYMRYEHYREAGIKTAFWVPVFWFTVEILCGSFILFVIWR